MSIEVAYERKSDELRQGDLSTGVTAWWDRGSCTALCNRADNSMGFWIRHDRLPTYAQLVNVRAVGALFEGIQLETCQDAEVVNFFVEDCRDGVAFTSGSLPCTGNKIANGIVQNSTSTGVLLKSQPDKPVERNEVANVAVRGTGSEVHNHGVVVDAGCHRNTFVSLKVSQSAGRGLQDMGRANQYQACQFFRNEDNGVVFVGSTDTTMVGCLAYGNRAHGVFFADAPRRPQIVAMVAEQNSGFGVLGGVDGGRLDIAGEGNGRGLVASDGWDYTFVSA